MATNHAVEAGGQRLDKYLHQLYKDISRSWIQKLIRDGKVLVNSKPAKAHLELQTGDVIEGDIVPPAEIDLSPDPKIKWETVFESKDYIVINKPAGLVVHPSEGVKTGTLVNGLLHAYPDIARVGEDILRPGIVHRLDKDVSGLMIVTLSQKAFEYFKQLFKEHKVNKKYTALVFGVGMAQSGKISFPLARSKKGKIVSVSSTDQSHKKQQWAETEFEIVKEFTNYTLLKISTITGRTHQIRAHLHGIGHPIVGDQIYKISRYQKFNSVDQIFLCADQLSFIDLGSKKQEFSIVLPKPLKSFLDQL